MPMWVYIIGGILLFVLVLMLSPVVLTVRYEAEEEVIAFVRFWFVRIQVLPKKEKAARPRKNKKVKAVKKEGASPGTIQKMVKKNGLADTLQLMISAAMSLPKIILRLLKGARVRNLELTLGVTGEDAARAAIHYGQVCGVLYPFLGVVSGHMKLIRPQVTVYCDYQGEKPTFRGKATLYVSLYHVVATAFYALKELILKNKGGKSYESIKRQSQK